MLGFGNKQTNKTNLDVFVMHDSKGNSYSMPEYALNEADQIRQLQNRFFDQNYQKALYITNAEDYACYKIGEYCRYTGTFFPIQHKHLVNLKDLRAVAQSSSPGVAST